MGSHTNQTYCSPRAAVAVYCCGNFYKQYERKKNMREEQNKLKALVQKQQLESVCKADSPEIATNIATTGCVEMACAIIDSLDELTAAFIIRVLRQRAKGEGSGASYSLKAIAHAE